MQRLDPLAEIVGEYMSSVTFVMDYVQLMFCGPSFNLYVHPSVRIGGQKFEFGEPGYRDALCSLIGKTVESADVFLDTGLEVLFSDGDALAVQLRVPAEYDTPEVATYSTGKTGWIWSTRGEPFE